MKHQLLIIIFLAIQVICFSQNNLINNKSIFLDGVRLEKPNYNFQWSFQLNDIPKEKFQNYRFHRKGMSEWAHIKFDSVLFLNKFLLSRVIVKVIKTKKDNEFKMKEFIGIVDFATLNKIETFFNYKWNGWIIYPSENPLYKFKLYRNKSEGAILIDSF